MITEQKLIDTIGALMDEYAQTDVVMTAKDMALRITERCKGLSPKAVADLVDHIFERRRVLAIAKPALDEDPSLTLGKALQVMADRGSEAAQRELDMAFDKMGLEMVEEVLREGDARRALASWTTSVRH
jgi:hypothetical protein